MKKTKLTFSSFRTLGTINLNRILNSLDLMEKLILEIIYGESKSINFFNNTANEFLFRLKKK